MTALAYHLTTLMYKIIAYELYLLIQDFKIKHRFAVYFYDESQIKRNQVFCATGLSISVTVDPLFSVFVRVISRVPQFNGLF